MGSDGDSCLDAPRDQCQARNQLQSRSDDVSRGSESGITPEDVVLALHRHPLGPRKQSRINETRLCEILLGYHVTASALQGGSCERTGTFFPS